MGGYRSSDQDPPRTKGEGSMCLPLPGTSDALAVGSGSGCVLLVPSRSTSGINDGPGGARSWSPPRRSPCLGLSFMAANAGLNLSARKARLNGLLLCRRSHRHPARGHQERPDRASEPGVRSGKAAFVAASGLCARGLTRMPHYQIELIHDFLGSVCCHHGCLHGNLL
jgi:hypothetical protein